MQICECNAEPACPDVMCDMLCSHGFKKDDNGCDVCECHECNNQMCRMYCEHGFKLDHNGCEVRSFSLGIQKERK